MSPVEQELVDIPEHLSSTSVFFFYFVLWSSCCSIFSFLCSVSYIIVVVFRLAIALSACNLNLLIPLWYLQTFAMAYYFDFVVSSIYIYVWKLNQTVLELDLWAEIFFVLPSMGFELTTWIHCSTNRLAYVQHPRPLDHIRYIKNITLIVEVLHCLVRKI
jgi:hypothetical protein